LIRTDGNNKALYVADRSSARIVVFSLDGTYPRTPRRRNRVQPIEHGGFDGHLVVPKLFGALAVFDRDEHTGLIGTSGRDHQASECPNHIDEAGQTVAFRVIRGAFNSRTASRPTTAPSISSNG
jgi:hypothetical protein